MKKDPEFEMLPAHDFSGAVRGRVAARFTPEERDALIRRVAAEEVQTWTAKCLLHAQKLGASLFTYLVLAEKRSPKEAGAEALTLLDCIDQRSVRQMLSSLRGKHPLLGGLAHRLAVFADERHWLVHRSGIEGQAVLASPDKAADLLDRLEHIAAEATALRSEIEALVAERLMEDGLSKQEIVTKRDETHDLWLAA
ncbi:MAG TPA: hypothetical protein VF710_11155 [Longimicrobium sp.]|jgi:hypothetical protein